MGLYVGSSKVSATSGSIDVVALSNITNAAIEATNNANAAADAAMAAADVAIGSTDVDNAELYNIRTGYDGTVYDSAGDAVRGQAEQIVASVKKATANYLRGEESGALVHVDDAWPSPVRGLTVYGKSEQFTTTGKNLIPNTYGTYETINGVSVSYDKESQTFTMNGTATSLGGRTNWIYNAAKFTLDAGAYSMTGYVVSGSGSENVSLVLTKDGTNESIAVHQFFTITETIEVYVGINFTNMSAISNLKIRVQLEAGSTATDWEPYTGGKPSPSPEYPQEIKSIGAADVVTCGKNLLKYPFEKGTSTSNGITFTDNGDGTIGISGTSSDVAYYNFAPNRETGWLRIPAGTYTVLFDAPAGVMLRMACDNRTTNRDIINNASSGSGVNLLSFTVGDNEHIFAYISVIGSGVTINGTVKVAIYAKSSDSKYSPYTGSTTPVSLAAEDGTAYELRSLPDGTRDEVGIVDGRWVLTRKVGHKIFDGSENWAPSGTRGMCRLANHDGRVTDTKGYNAMCDRLPVLSGQDVYEGETGITSGAAFIGSPGAYVGIKAPECTTAAEMKAWLAENNVTLDYALETHELIDLGPADTPLLPETVSNVWAVSEPSTEVGVTYERDVTVAYNNLCAAIVAAGATE